MLNINLDYRIRVDVSIGKTFDLYKIAAKIKEIHSNAQKKSSIKKY